MSTPREMLARVTEGSFLLPIFYSMHMDNFTLTAGVYLAHFADDTCIYARDHKMFSESCSAVSIKLRRGASDETITSMKIKFGSSNSPTDFNHLSFMCTEQTES
jgi:hypothetical protein